MIIHKDCFGTIFWVWIIAAPIAFIILKFIPWAFVSYPLAAIPMFFMGFVTFFFRVPSRCRVGEDNVVTSVADGRVVVIEKAFESEFYLSIITLKELENIKTSIYKDEETKYKARHILHLLLENEDKYKVDTTDWSSYISRYGLPNTNDSLIIISALSIVTFDTDNLVSRDSLFIVSIVAVFVVDTFGYILTFTVDGSIL